MKILQNLTKIIFLKYSAELIIRICRLLFSVSMITFIFYFILEYFKTGLISNYFDLNLLLVISILSGLILLIFDEISEIARFNGGKLFLLIAISLIAGLLSYQYLQNLEKVRYFIPPMVIITVFMIIYLHQNKDYD